MALFEPGDRLVPSTSASQRSLFRREVREGQSEGSACTDTRSRVEEERGGLDIRHRSIPLDTADLKEAKALLEKLS